LAGKKYSPYEALRDFPFEIFSLRRELPSFPLDCSLTENSAEFAFKNAITSAAFDDEFFFI
jgi:hypothetical protein